MVLYRRNRVPCGTCFFTVTLNNGRSAALVQHIAHLRQAIRTARAKRPFTGDAIVVLPDHLHAIMTLPDGDADFSGRWRRIKSVFSRRVAARDSTLHCNVKGEFALWHRRFWKHTVRDDEDFARCFDYLHFNPVAHGLTPRVSDGPFSSFHRYVRKGWLPLDWGGDAAESAVARMERSAIRDCKSPPPPEDPLHPGYALACDRRHGTPRKCDQGRGWQASSLSST